MEYTAGNLLTNYMRGQGVGISVISLINTFILRNVSPTIDTVCSLVASLCLLIQLICAFLWDGWRTDCQTRVNTLYALVFIEATSYWVFQLYITLMVSKISSQRYYWAAFIIGCFLVRFGFGIAVQVQYTFGVNPLNRVCTTRLSVDWNLADRLVELWYDLMMILTLVYHIARNQKGPATGVSSLIKLLVVDKASVLFVSGLVQAIFLLLVYTSTDPTNLSVLNNIPNTAYVVYLQIHLIMSVARRLMRKELTSPTSSSVKGVASGVGKNSGI